MLVRGTQPGVQFYTSQFLNGENGKARVSEAIENDHSVSATLILYRPFSTFFSWKNVMKIAGHPIERRSIVSSSICFLSRNSAFSRFTKSQKLSIS